MVEADARGRREPWRSGGVHVSVGNALQHLPLETLAERADALCLCCPPAAGEFCRSPEANDPGDVFRARSAVPLVPPAVLNLAELQPASHVERTDALWPVDLVSAQAEHVHAKIVHARRDLTEALHAIAVKGHARSLGNPADLSNGLQRAQLVVGVHHADQDRLGPQCRADTVRGNEAVTPWGHIGDCHAFRFKLLARIEHRWVFNLRGDHVACRLRGGSHCSEDRQIVGLGASAGEDHVSRMAAQLRGDLPAGGLDAQPGLLSECVQAGSIAVDLPEVGDHGLQHPGIDGRGGIVVEVAAPHRQPQSMSSIRGRRPKRGRQVNRRAGRRRVRSREMPIAPSGLRFSGIRGCWSQEALGRASGGRPEAGQHLPPDTTLARIEMMRFFVSALVVAIAWAPAAGASELADQASAILKQECQMCHGAAIQQSGLDLRTREKILTGGERGPAVVGSNPPLSWLWKLVTHEVKPSMPPGKKLDDGQIEVLRKWIMAGAPMPEGPITDEEAERRAALKKLEERPITEEERAWWAFVKPVRSPLPGQAGANPVDAFLEAKQLSLGLAPSPEASRRALVRRLYLDLTGLPPTPGELQAFLKDESSDAWPALVDRLLDSSHYGERWGRHWLDLVHYADSGGYERDFDWPTMWRYRDYVVDAFNNDVPYDRFVREQIAGDEIYPDLDRAHVATGFLRMVLDNNIKDERTRMDELDDNVATTAQTFLAVTAQCARCHNHKFDPIPQKDYYRMQAVFFSTKETDYPLVGPAVVQEHERLNKEIGERQKPLRKRLEGLEAPHRKALFEVRLDELAPYYREAWETPPEKRDKGQRLNARQVEALLSQIAIGDILDRMEPADKAEHSSTQAKIEDLDSRRPAPFPTARTVTEESRNPLPSYFLHRGDPGSKGSLMQPGVLTVAARMEPAFPEPPEPVSTSWRRKHFAEWIASPDNPLTARVMVNRIWQHHFGEGIVRTPSNFGKTGSQPSHPELLDWLAEEFVDSGWSVKHMHRLMLTSKAYRAASRDIPANLEKDPENAYFWRQSRNRHEAEVIRDQILAAAGTLDLEVGGPAVRPYIDPALFQSSTDRTWPGMSIGDPRSWRRSIYVFSKRSIRYPMFEAFDQPDMVTSCSERTRSTVAPQALLLMNNAEVLLQSKYFAQRVALEAGHDPRDQVRHAFDLALSREPSGAEMAKALEFVGSTPTGLVDLCQTLFNLNEFLYRQ